MQTGAIRRGLKRVPGLAPAYRALRAAWWRLRASMPLGLKAKRRAAAYWGGEHARLTTETGKRPTHCVRSRSTNRQPSPRGCL